MNLTKKANFNPDALNKEIAESGYILIRDALPKTLLDNFEMHFLDLVFELTQRRFSSIQNEEFTAMVSGDRELERRLYDQVREYPWLVEFSSNQSIVDAVRSIRGFNIGLLEKIPMRIDLPMVMREAAVWHQDYHYVRGNTEVVTAWIPLQDTPYELGCLMVMPQSHKLGVLEHDKPLLQKKYVPSCIFEQPVKYVEMRRGDLLLFDALLLHSSGYNISNRPRFSIQARYSPLNLPTDPAMGKLLPLNKA
jgi:ectoine hydroxylase-related dioxygenase (phytanoyl-CoA dioxygenase family)